MITEPVSYLFGTDVLNLRPIAFVFSCIEPYSGFCLLVFHALVLGLTKDLVLSEVVGASKSLLGALSLRKKARPLGVLGRVTSHLRAKACFHRHR